MSDADAAPDLRSRAYLALVVVAGVLGGIVSLVAAGYVWVYHEGIELVWSTLPDELGVERFAWWYVVVATTIGGIAVGLVLRFVPGRGGPSPVVGHSLGGSSDYRVAPAAALATIVSLVAGASLGPEAALVTIAGALGGWTAVRLGLTERSATVLSVACIAGVLGAFFGSPLVAALLPLEIVSLTGLLLYALLIPGLVAAVVGVEVFDALHDGPLFHYTLPQLDSIGVVDLLYAAAVGVGGGIVARVFMALVRASHRAVDPWATSRPVLTAGVGGLAIGILGIGGDHLTLFSGESSLQALIDGRNELALSLLVYVLLAKIAATTISLTTGFRGGQIFPVIFIGAAFGVVVARLVDGVPDAVALAAGMTAAAVAVMRVPVAAILIVSFLVGVELVPVVVIAAVAGYITSFDMPVLGAHEDVVEGPEPPDATELTATSREH